MPGPTTILLDLDGTLVDSMPDLQAALNSALARCGRPPLSLAALRQMWGHGAPVLVERALRATDEGCEPVAPEELLDLLQAAHRAGGQQTTRLYPGVRETLQQLREAGYLLGICTNKPQEATRALLRALDLQGAVHAVTGGGSLQRRKPDPEPLLATLRAAGGIPQRSVMVGDTRHDVEAAHRAGMPAVLVSYGYHRVPIDELAADVVIHTFPQLAAALHQLALHP